MHQSRPQSRPRLELRPHVSTPRGSRLKPGANLLLEAPVEVIALAPGHLLLVGLLLGLLKVVLRMLSRA